MRLSGLRCLAFPHQYAALGERVEEGQRWQHHDDSDAEHDQHRGQRSACAGVLLDRQTLGEEIRYWATPQPQITATTAPTASARVPRRCPRKSRARTPSPNTPDAITSGSPSLVRP